MYSIEQLIEQKALNLGFEKCGIISTDRMKGYNEKFKERLDKVKESEPFYEGQKRLLKFQSDYPWAKSIIVITIPYSKYNVPEELEGHIGKSYLYDIRIDENSEENKNRNEFERFMESLGLKIAANHKFGIVGMRWAALEAGLGVIRRNNFFYSESGSWVHLEAWITDREMELCHVTDIKPCPSGCNRCVNACPTKSLTEGYTMNPLKCISFLTTFGGRNLHTEPLAEKFGECIYGCDICQDVCPMNHKKWKGGKSFNGLAELASSLTVEGIMNMKEDFYRNRIQPKFFYLTAEELWKWQVNVLNFMNNQYKEDYRELIIKACNSEYEKVREMAEYICRKRRLIIDNSVDID